jgi:hypothetical protein
MLKLACFPQGIFSTIVCRQEASILVAFAWSGDWSTQPIRPSDRQIVVDTDSAHGIYMLLAITPSYARGLR